MTLQTNEKLINEINQLSQEVRSNSMGYSIGELKRNYDSGAIDVQPDFQRVYRWTDKQKSSLIESIILQIPLPPIFVAQTNDGNWDVVDGVQRLSTIFSFMGSKVGEAETNFKLSDLEYLKEAEGSCWDELPQIVQRNIEQTRVDVTIVQATSSPEAKYNLFLRLNSGSILSGQELRNCMLVMINKHFFNGMKECATYSDFVEIVQPTEKEQQESYVDELALRYFLQQDFNGPESGLKVEFSDFLTDWAKSSAALENYMNEERIDSFKKCISLLLEVGGEDIFRGRDPRRPGSGSRSIGAFEFVCSGVGANLEYWLEHKKELAEKLKTYRNAEVLTEKTAANRSARQRFPRIVLSGKSYFG